MSHEPHDITRTSGSSDAAMSASDADAESSSGEELPPPIQKTFKRNAHIAYFLRCLRALPSQAQEHDSNRITIAYFCVSGLDLLGALEEKTTQEQRDGWIEWIWSLQSRDGGFKGSTFMDIPNATDDTSPGHIPSTYTALLTLAILRAPLDRLDKAGLAKFVARCQADDGSFSPLPPKYMEAGGFQNDVRMTYCASVISSIIGEWDFDVPKARGFIERCKTWEGGYASRPGVIEAQGGTTYCSVASLSLLARSSTESAIITRPSSSDPTLRWLLQRQIGGFQGRPGKSEDVCYSFWIGGAISLLSHSDLVNSPPNRSFLLSSQTPMGGFSKEPGEYPDPFHSYLALAALALSPSPSPQSGSTSAEHTRPEMQSALELKDLDVGWNVSVETASWLKREIERVK